MSKLGRFLAVVVFTGLLVSASMVWAERALVPGGKVMVEIDYGSMRPARTVEASWVKGRTALLALQSVAEVGTHPVGENVFVVSIDGIEGKRGETAWYYTLDGRSCGQLAYTKVLEAGQRMKWEYKKDVCSWKVDGKPKPE